MQRILYILLEYLFQEKFFECDRSFERELFIECLLDYKSIWLRGSSFIETKDSCYIINKQTFSSEKYF